MIRTHELPTIPHAVQNIAMLGPAACMITVMWSQSQPDASSDIVIPLISAADGLLAFSLAGLYCTHADLSSKVWAPQVLRMGCLISICKVSCAWHTTTTTPSIQARNIYPNGMCARRPTTTPEHPPVRTAVFLGFCLV